MNILWGLMGCSIIFSIAYLVSGNRKAINFRTVGLGFLLQLVFGYIVLKSQLGREVLQAASNGVNKVIHYGDVGLAFVFGSLADKTGPAGSVFAVRVLAIVIFLSALISLLYYLGIMQFFVKIIGGFISRILKVSKTESMSATANIFVGMSEAPLVIKPYLPHMTKSQIFAVMVGGLASVSGAVMIGLAAMGVSIEYLIAASFMSAPAGLVMAKMLMPETEDNTEINLKAAAGASEETKKRRNILEVIMDGANDGAKIAFGVAVMLVAIIGLVALVNGLLGGIGSLIGFDKLSLQLIFGYLFSPIAFIIGIPWNEAVMAGNLIGQKLVFNEFVAFTSYAGQMGEFSAKAQAVITFTLCGFANLGSIGILVGALSSMAPNKKSVIQSMAFRALMAGSLANLMSGAIAGIYF
ncbi:NupC/NupG family nucleoside CNT transporter [Bacillus sp. FJAT-27245]|uniref:NupC/NupG family nucleoside CNT transporter n=1 Tax=Bacillus sp. FJAT-27245 TaxID=1684144 RepID=UPI0006A7A49B|nr:NupC/NupG family nucleoside CNT transporter [Bacillus sp. FJAT-27245]